MIIICASCRKPMGSKPPYDDHRTSHAICTNCFDAQIKELRLKKAERLNICVAAKNPIANQAT